jgi:phosphohistidine phosphatase
MKSNFFNKVASMKTLLLMRHAKSSWKDTGLADFERPLKKRGKKDSARVAKLLAKKDLVPQLILCSSAKRAHQTAEILIDECDFQGEIEYLDSFYMAEPGIFYDILKSLPDVDSVMLIGHNPGLETLLQLMNRQIASLPTGALAYLSLQIDSWQDLDEDTPAELVEFWRPRDLK